MLCCCILFWDSQPSCLVAQLWLTLSGSHGSHSPPGSSIHWLLQARTDVTEQQFIQWKDTFWGTFWENLPAPWAGTLGKSGLSSPWMSCNIVTSTCGVGPSRNLFPFLRLGYFAFSPWLFGLSCWLWREDISGFAPENCLFLPTTHALFPFLMSVLKFKKPAYINGSH